jgi:Planctomycete cytochrome C
MRRFVLTLALAVGLGTLAPAARAADDPKELAVKAGGIFKQYCYRCHHGDGLTEGDFNVLKVKTLTEKLGDAPKPLIVRGKSSESYLYVEKLSKKKMPPEEITLRPNDDEIDVIKRWIDAGAPEVPAVVKREFVSQKAVLTAIRDHLRAADKDEAPYLRFFTLTHLYNNPNVPNTDLPLYRAALSKAINSLSWKPDIVVPQAIDKEQTVFVVDVRDLDWDRDNLWRTILKHYPYGLNYSNVAELSKLQDDISERTSCELAYIRADWFIATATRPPLYHTLLRLPKTVGELEAKLNVYAEDDFLHAKLQRAGFIKSGVSEQNRLVERHAASYGSYWKSFDFKKDNDRGNLLRFPLGPDFKKNQYHDQAFVQDGGEMIFHLPNQMMGYFLVDGQDKRIDVGPIAVVSDPLKTSGTNEIVTGLSCMACHKQGVFPLPKDAVRDGKAVFGDAQKKVQRLYPESEQMAKYTKRDTDRFVRALEEATGPFLKVGADEKKPITEFNEPIGEIARLYRNVDLDLAMVAYELDLENPKDLVTKLGEKKLKDLELGTLLREKGVIKRAEWEGGRGTSRLQKTATALEHGSPRTVD